MKKLLTVVFLLSASAALAQHRLMDKEIRVREIDSNGVPTFVTGKLGRLLGPGSVESTARTFLRAQSDVLPMDGTEDFASIATTRDELGLTHIKLQQKINGLPVVGAEYIVHADQEGRVVAMNGRFAAGRDLPRHATMEAWSSIERAVAQAGIENPSYGSKPTLTYVVNDKGRAFLAWTTSVAYNNELGEQVEIIYSDATTGDLAVRNPQYHYARNRITYNGNNSSSLPGTQVLTETGGSTSDTVISNAHGHAATSYDYYKNVHNRDSFNNAGATIKTTVHHQSNYNNAFWNGTQLVYGDGDGSSFSPLGNSLDVGAHELSHAVTTYSANLTYSNESGALNEGTSDIMAAAAEAWKDGSVNSDTWKIGEDVYTPGTSGDALRYMNNPTQDGSSYDYYPERYTGSGDYGGVHLNSGIANLAFKLMVTGGTHPRGKTTVNVTALSATATTSIDMAAKIWYRALTVYMTSSTNFSGARTATRSAATDLYGATAANTVTAAWDAVGAPGGTPPPSGTVTLTNGVTVTGIGASTGAWKHYKIVVPSGQSSLAIVMSGGTGDADMYVKRGAQPTSSSYDYRPYLNGNNETVNVSNPVAGDWFISLYAYSTFASTTLKATYSGAAPPPACQSGALAGTGSNWYSTQYTSSVSGTHTGNLTGTGADFDLYLQKWNGASWATVKASEGATSTESISYAGTAGTYRYRVYAYSGGGTLSLCTTKP